MQKYSHPQSLFHYTHEEDLFIKILKEGFKFSYCEEHLPNKSFVAFPMVCFCDIHLENSINHTETYGKWGIGISKDYLINNYEYLFGPVNYVLKSSFIDAAFSIRELYLEKMNFINELKNKKTLKDEEAYKFFQELSDSHQLNIQSISAIALMKPYSSNKIINYNECEWRMFIPENGKPRNNNDEKCKWFWDKEEYLNAKGNKKPFFYLGYILQPSAEAISHLVVPQKDDKNKIKADLNQMDVIFGKKVEKRTIEGLADRIISFEEIENNN